MKRIGVRDLPGSHEKGEAVNIGAGPTDPFVHVATGDPFRSGCYADLIPSAVVADTGSGGMRAVTVVVARSRYGDPTAIRESSDAGADGIPPVVIVIGGAAVPTAVVGKQRGVIPHDAGVGIGVDNPLARVSSRPHRGGIDLLHSPLDCRGCRGTGWPGGLERHAESAIRLDGQHVRAGCQLVHHSA